MRYTILAIIVGTCLFVSSTSSSALGRSFEIKVCGATPLSWVVAGIYNADTRTMIASGTDADEHGIALIVLPPGRWMVFSINFNDTVIMLEPTGILTSNISVYCDP